MSQAPELLLIDVLTIFGVIAEFKAVGPLTSSRPTFSYEVFMLIGFCIAMMVFSLCWLLLLAFFPRRWERFIDWENQLTLRCGLPPGVAAWFKRHETGATMKIVVGLLVVVSFTCLTLAVIARHPGVSSAGP